MGASYPKTPVVLVFKTSNRSNARIKMKVFKNKNIDHINEKKLPGVPEKAVILDMAIGEQFIEYYKRKYKL